MVADASEIRGDIIVVPNFNILQQTTSNGVVIPVDIVNGLARIPMRPFTDHEFDELPTIFLADESKPWNPSVLNSTSSSEDYWLKSHPQPTNNNPSFLMTGDYLRRSVLLSDVAWTFDAWEDKSAKPSDEDVIVVEHPAQDTDESIEIEIAFDVPEPPLIRDENMSVSHSEQDNTSNDHCDLDDLVDNVVEYSSDLKNHTELVRLIQAMTEIDTTIDGLRIYSCEREPPDKLLVFAVTTHVPSKAEHARETPPEEPPTKAPPPEPVPTPNALHSQVQPPVPDNGEIERPDVEDNLFRQPIKVTGQSQTAKPSKKDWETLRPLFQWLDVDTIKKTFDRTTQLARMPQGEQLKRHFRSPHPALNVLRQDEALATDTIYSDVSAIFGGETIAQFYVGLTTQVCNAYGIRSEKQFVNTLEDIIRERGAPSKLVSDSAQVEISKRVKDILRTLVITDWQSTPHKHQQNPAKQQYQTVVHLVNLLMDCTGAPPNLWLKALKYVCFLLNHTYNANIDVIPLEKLTGQQVDISTLLRFHWYHCHTSIVSAAW